MELLYGGNISRQGVNKPRSGNGALNRVGIQEGRFAENQQKYWQASKESWQTSKLAAAFPRANPESYALKSQTLPKVSSLTVAVGDSVWGSPLGQSSSLEVGLR